MSHVTKGNVFADLGFSQEESFDLAMKVDLASEIRKFIERHQLTQANAALFFKVPRPKISLIKSGSLDGISIEYLIRMLAVTGGKLSYSFTQPPKLAASKRVRAQLQACA